MNINTLQLESNRRANLKDLFDERLVLDAENCIYCIHNIKDDKCYVGQTINLYRRLIGSSLFSHRTRYLEENDALLYDAIRLDGPENFEVIILEDKLEQSQLDDREIYWIERLNTCIYNQDSLGYNRCNGGHNPFSTPGFHREISLIQMQNHGGVLAFHTEEAKAHQRAAMQKFADENYDGQLMGACHEEPIEVIASYRMRKSRLINSIKSRLKPGMTLDDYLSTYTIQKSRAFIDRIKDFGSELRKDDRWTAEMESLFGSIIDTNYKATSEKSDKFIRTVDSQFTFINNLLHRMDVENQVINFYNYYWMTTEFNIQFLHDHIDDFISDYRWNALLEDLFNDIRDKLPIYRKSKFHGIIYRT